MRTLTSLGLTVLRLLDQQPQHPYELRQQMREQGLDRIVKVTHGALYHTVETLAKAELVTPTETTREGKRPERTVYAITETGREVARERLRELLITVTPEYPAYRTALAFMGMLPEKDAADLLDRRAIALDGELAAVQTGYDAAIKQGLPAIALVEIQHMQAHIRADVELTKALADDIRGGRLTWR
nr:PadR family transcriptional regulator [Kibdelosporangium sp. MJ126-NF4]CEL20186.1 Transcriptional regulator, PadR family [Kibdelosporangium sp. MJ126-NF4]CTQ97411.1 Transcriptional regulator, PadR family [Kibdelosporangium sp. MJ126-NF4]